MILQLTTGIGGPRECAYALAGIFRKFKEEFPDIQVADVHKAKDKGCFTSIVFTTEEDLSFLEGTLLWVGKSPFRPHHKRKNWYVGCSIIPETTDEEIELKPEDLKVERFHSGGHGGQNVNKVETGIRLIHVPTGIRVACTSERTQHANRRIAEKRLQAILADRKEQVQSSHRKAGWRKHSTLERGNPVRIYTGNNFQRILSCFHLGKT